MNAVLQSKTRARQVVSRSDGRQQHGITRLMRPSDLGELVKPFVFLDNFDIAGSRDLMAGMHPHSGLATVTVISEGAVEYIDTIGNRGTLAAGGVEWMQAGGGVWHSGAPSNGGAVRGFQLWVALQPEDENGPAHAVFLAADQVESSGPARVILGSHGGALSAIHTRASINYLQVSLKDGEHWRYAPPAGHDVAWVALAKGQLQVAGAVLGKEIAVFDRSDTALDFVAQGDTEFVLGSAVKHPHPLVLGYYSVHTSPEALRQGEARIVQIQAQLPT
ncbi:MAG: pirin family protein [Massilia sp.]